jgi:hypothetical protein
MARGDEFLLVRLSVKSRTCQKRIDASIRWQRVQARQDDHLLCRIALLDPAPRRPFRPCEFNHDQHRYRSMPIFIDSLRAGVTSRQTNAWRPARSIAKICSKLDHKPLARRPGNPAVRRSGGQAVWRSGAETGWRMRRNNGPLTSGASTSIMAHFPAVSLPSL